MDIREMSAHDELAEVVGLCERELTLDRDAGMLPGILMRRPYLALVATDEAAVVGACFGAVTQSSQQSPAGFIDLVVVDRRRQGEGIGGRLVSGMEDWLASRGCERIDIAGGGTHYAWPGIDLHYTAAICMAEDLGYTRGSCEVNMDVDLTSAALDSREAVSRLRGHGIDIRRADLSDEDPMRQSLSGIWDPTWIAQITAALHRDQSGLHLAWTQGRCIGFCAYGVNRGHEVGPVGTDPAARNLGIATVLLQRCLAEQRDRGVTAAELVWVGPLSYYSRAVRATVGRAFWQYGKDLNAPRRADWLAGVGLARPDSQREN